MSPRLEAEVLILGCRDTEHSIVRNVCLSFASNHTSRKLTDKFVLSLHLVFDPLGEELLDLGLLFCIKMRGLVSADDIICNKNNLIY